MKPTVHYLSFNVDENTKDNLIYFPSAQPKIKYIADTIKKTGFKVNIVSSCLIKNNGFFVVRSYIIDNFESHIYFTSFRTPIKLFNKISTILSWIQLIVYCLFYAKKNDKILIYHSLYYLLPMKIVSKLKKLDFMLDVEDIYSCLSKENKRYFKSEINFINLTLE